MEKYLLILILITAVITDFHRQRIPNWLTFPAMAGGMFLALLGKGVQGFTFSLLGLVVGISLLLIPYMLSGMGAGDVKLMGAVGSFLGITNVIWACLFSCVIGLIYALCVLIFKKNIQSYLTRYWLITKMVLNTGSLSYIPPPPGENTRLHYALPIALGAISFIIGNDLNLGEYLP